MFFFVVASVSFVLFLMGKINMSVCGMGGKGVLTGDWGKRRKQEGGYQLGSWALEMPGERIAHCQAQQWRHFSRGHLAILPAKTSLSCTHHLFRNFPTSTYPWDCFAWTFPISPITSCLILQELQDLKTLGRYWSSSQVRWWWGWSLEKTLTNNQDMDSHQW